MKIRYLYTFSFSEKVLFNSFSDAQLKVLEDKLKCNYAIVTKKTEEIVEFKINPFKTPNWTTMGGANRGEFYLTTNGRQNKLVVYKVGEIPISVKQDIRCICRIDSIPIEINPKFLVA